MFAAIIAAVGVSAEEFWLPGIHIKVAQGQIDTIDVLNIVEQINDTLPADRQISLDNTFDISMDGNRAGLSGMNKDSLETPYFASDISLTAAKENGVVTSCVLRSRPSTVEKSSTHKLTLSIYREAYNDSYIIPIRLEVVNSFKYGKYNGVSRLEDFALNVIVNQYDSKDVDEKTRPSKPMYLAKVIDGRCYVVDNEGADVDVDEVNPSMFYCKDNTSVTRLYGTFDVAELMKGYGFYALKYPDNEAYHLSGDKSGIVFGILGSADDGTTIPLEPDSLLLVAGKPASDHLPELETYFDIVGLNNGNCAIRATVKYNNARWNYIDSDWDVDTLAAPLYIYLDYDPVSRTMVAVYEGALSEEELEEADSKHQLFLYSYDLREDHSPLFSPYDGEVTSINGGQTETEFVNETDPLTITMTFDRPLAHDDDWNVLTSSGEILADTDLLTITVDDYDFANNGSGAYNAPRKKAASKGGKPLFAPRDLLGSSIKVTVTSQVGAIAYATSSGTMQANAMRKARVNNDTSYLTELATTAFSFAYVIASQADADTFKLAEEIKSAPDYVIDLGSESLGTFFTRQSIDVSSTEQLKFYKVSDVAEGAIMLTELKGNVSGPMMVMKAFEGLSHPVVVRKGDPDETIVPERNFLNYCHTDYDRDDYGVLYDYIPYYYQGYYSPWGFGDGGYPDDEALDAVVYDNQMMKASNYVFGTSKGKDPVTHEEIYGKLGFYYLNIPEPAVGSNTPGYRNTTSHGIVYLHSYKNLGSTAAGAPVMVLLANGSVAGAITAIGEITAGQGGKANAAAQRAYNIMGQAVSSGYSGIIVRDGKKVINK